MVLGDVIDLLACPVCQGSLELTERSLRCGAGHSFDVARQGYVNLLPGGADPGTADSAEMVVARIDFLGAGHYDPLMAGLAELAAGWAAAVSGGDGAQWPGDGGTPGSVSVLDAGAGAGHYLAAVLDRLPASRGLALDLSKHALRRAARAHPRLGAAVADLWRPLPVASDSIDVILNVFAPRNAPAFARVLARDGVLLVVTPTPRHLAPVIAELGLVTVDERKPDRLATTLGGHFTRVASETLEFTAKLTHAELASLVGMGPSARHLSEKELQSRLVRLPNPTEVPFSFELTTFAANESVNQSS